MVAALIGGQEWGRGEGATKKEAEQEAARLALEAFERRGRGRRRREPGSGEPAFSPAEPAEALVAEAGPRLEPSGERRRVAPEPDVLPVEHEPFEQGPEKARPPASPARPARPAAPADDAFSAGIAVPAAPAARPPAAPAPAPAEPAPVRVVPSRKKAPAAWTPPPEGDGFGSGL